MAKAPFNITIPDVDKYVEKRNMLPVTSQAMFEPSSTRMHPDGLFSEVIFGNIGTTERMVRRGFINLKTKLISPHLFKQIISLKKYYGGIISGKDYAYFDTNEKDLILTDKSDPRARTGYDFFITTLPKIEFKYSASVQRKDKIDLLKKYKNVLTMDKLIVIPAGLRDVRESNGRMSSEDINKLYSSVLALSKALPPDGVTEDSVFDTVRYQLQMKIQEIYNYLADLLDGKGGFSQKRYAARAVVYATRNVITAANISGCIHPDSPDMFGMSEVQLPLYQAMKTYTPIVIHSLRTIFFENVFGQQVEQVPLINPKTYELNYYDVTRSTVKQFTSNIEDFINNFRNMEIQDLPVTVEVADNKSLPYLYMVYDLGNVIIPFRSLSDLKNAHDDEIDDTKIRPMTYIEMAYIATCNALKGKYVSSVRHPVFNMQGNDMYSVHLVSTVPSRIVEIKNIAGSSEGIVMDSYPIGHKPAKQSMSVHPSILAALDGDHDGDVLGAMGIMSEDATKEVAEYLESPLSMIDSNGKLMCGLNTGRIVKLQMFATSWHPLN